MAEWERLLVDLEARAEVLAEAELASEVADRTRRERALVTLAQRLVAAQAQSVGLDVVGAGAISGRVGAVGPDWVLVNGSAGFEVLVSLASVTAVRGLGPWSVPDAQPGSVSTRLDLAWALRRIAIDRRPVRVTTVASQSYSGTLDRVGRDHIDLALHDLMAPRRRREVSESVAVPIRAVSALLQA